MPATPIYGLRYPAAADPADVPLDLQELAEDVEAKVPGRPLAYVEFTSIVTVTATTAGAATVLVTAPSLTFDGATPILIDFGACSVNPSTGNLSVALFDGSTELGTLLYISGNFFWPVRCTRRLTPSAGAHTYSIRAWGSVSGGTVYGGAGGTGNFAPGFIRVERT